MVSTEEIRAGIDIPADEIDLSLPESWKESRREGIFATLRADLPISKQTGLPFYDPATADPELLQASLDQGMADPGTLEWWAVTRHADVLHVSRHPDIYASGLGGTNIGDIPQEIAEFLGSMINMDAPRHTKLRKLVNRGFTPRQVARIDDAVHERARNIVDGILDRGTVDFVEDVAAALPLQIICDMMGIPPSDEHQIFEWTNTILGVGDPEMVATFEDLMAAGFGLFQYGLSLAEDRAATPRDDITTTLVEAEVDGERLTPAEIGSFFVLLVVAGNETTRNAISHGMLALTNHPDQKRAWLGDLPGLSPTATEEIVRWATPVIHFRRTVTEGTRLGDIDLKAGDRVAMFYNSANRDEAVFTDPYRFDLSRSPNEHVGFGGGGPHFCLGANLARREISVMFEELLRRIPEIEVSGEPAMLRSAFIHGIKRMSASW